MPIDRRTFLSLASTWGVGHLLSLVGVTPQGLVISQPPTPRVVHIAHLSRRQGPLAETAGYALMGAQLAAEEGNVAAEMLGSRVELLTEEMVRTEQTAETVRKLATQANLTAIIGALDDLSTAVLSEVCQQQRIVFINAAARGGGLRGAQCHRYTFHVEPDLAMYAHAVGQWLLQNNLKRWYFVVAGDLIGQEMYEKASRFLQSRGGMELGRSISVRGQQDYTTVLESLAKMNAEALFVALMGEDLRRFLDQFRQAGRPGQLAGAPLDMISLWNIDAESASGIWATAWYHALARFSARELNRRFLRRFNKPMEGHAWASWAAVKLVVEGALRGAGSDATALVNYLEGSPAFDGHKGKTLTFRPWNHQLRQPLYVVKARQSKPANAWDLLEVVAEVRSPAARGRPVWELLDTVGEAKAESPCQFEPL